LGRRPNRHIEKGGKETKAVGIKDLIAKYAIRPANENRITCHRKGITAAEANILRQRKPEILEFFRQEKKAEEQARDPRTNNLSARYYFGDWYRFNAFFTEAGEIVVWKKEYFPGLCPPLTPENIEAAVIKFLNINLYTGPKIENQHPDLHFKWGNYNDMRGKGQYVWRVIFPTWDIFMTYVKRAIRPMQEKENTKAAKIMAAYTKAKETGERQLLWRSVKECNDPHEECSCDIISEYALPTGVRIVERQHTW